MIAELVHLLLEQLALAAIDDYAMLRVTNDGPDARFVALDPESRICIGAFVPRGETIAINRAWRLLVQPIDAVLIKPLCDLERGWSTS